jgi:hypothetical protein
VIKIVSVLQQVVSVLQQVDDFLRVLQFPPNKTDRHAITEILLKVDLESKMATWCYLIKHFVSKQTLPLKRNIFTRMDH